MKNLMKLSFLMLAVALFTSCKNTSGDKAEVSEAAEVKAAEGTSYAVDIANSKVLWEGSKPTGTHNGTVNISEGSVSVKDGKVTGGSFIMDMNSIVSLDQQGDMKANLEAHLKGTAAGKEDDFFNAPKYPTAKFEITKMAGLANNPEATHLVYGNLTMREITHEVGFKAKVDVTGTSVSVSSPQFVIDRTKWDIKYGSKSIFDDLKDKFINDEIGLQVTLMAKG